MPVHSYRIHKECPRCKNKTMFNVDNLKYFCNVCMIEIPIEDSTQKKEEISDQILDPEILLN